jgi:hypothetical protein
MSISSASPESISKKMLSVFAAATTVLAAATTVLVAATSMLSVATTVLVAATTVLAVATSVLVAATTVLAVATSVFVAFLFFDELSERTPALAFSIIKYKEFKQINLCYYIYTIIILTYIDC